MFAVAAARCSASRRRRARDDDLPGRVARVADVAGELFLAPQDQPEQWTPIGINYPVTGGDNLWAGADVRAEIDFGGGQFRLANDTNLHVSRLDDRQFALFVAQGRVSIRVRVLDAGEAAYVDTPNAQIVLTRPGLYRVDVSNDREHTRLVVREGEANVLTPGANQQVLPGQTAVVDGPNGGFAAVNNGVASDPFDAWAAGRDRRYERGTYASYVSPQMVGAAELDQYGTWSQVPEYGTVWYPNGVAADWAPYRNGYWADVGAWGPTWVDAAPWGYAPFHYGRWVYFGNRWGWAPGAYVARPIWAPALVGWTGGPGWGVSVSVGGPVFGWVPLGWGEPYRPWWGRCSFGCWDRYNRPYNVNVNRGRPDSPPPPRYRNASVPGGLSVVSGNTLLMRRPVGDNLVAVPANAAGNAPVLTSAPMVRSEPGRIPTRSVGGGSPPPASTFYPTLSRPAGAPVPVALQPNRPAAQMDATTRTRAPQSAVVGAPTSRPAPSASAPTAGAFPAPSAGGPGLSRQQPGNAVSGSPASVTVPPVSRPVPQTVAPAMQAPSRQTGQGSAPVAGGTLPATPPAMQRATPSTYPGSRQDSRGLAPPPAQSAPIAPAAPASGMSRSAPRPQSAPVAAPVVPQAPPVSRAQPQAAAPPAAAPQGQPPAAPARSGNDGGNMNRQGRGDPGASPDRGSSPR